MARWGSKTGILYPVLLVAAFGVALASNWIFGASVDNAAYDLMFRLDQPQPWATQSVLLAIDERTLEILPGGMRGVRKPLAEAIELVAAARPKAVAVDIVLADPGDPVADAALAAAFRATPNLVLSSQLLRDGWEAPLAEFQRAATAIGHVQALPSSEDAVTRAIPLEMRAGYQRLWALPLEAFRLSRRAPIIESPGTLQVGSTLIPTIGPERQMRVRFLPEGEPFPRVSLRQLLENHSLASRFAGKVVFVGGTAQALHDRLFTPYSSGIPTSGLEINAAAFETMAQGLFISELPVAWTILFSMALVIAAGLAFRFLGGGPAYLAGVGILLIATLMPYAFFTHQRIFGFSMSVFSAWAGTLTAAAYYHLVVRRNLRRSEAERTRYQQAVQFVTHEMRTPLSAIQGSSELISRYQLTEDKRKQIAMLINSESKRLARMVEIFLNVERLSAGQMELKREPIAVKEMVETCVTRAHPLAERKHIGITLEPMAPEMRMTGDRELMEYACYNLLTNAIKYSPQKTKVTVTGAQDGGHLRIAVKDQGIGMDQKEVRQIFQKFYRTRKAEESGEAGTGIGLSIVQQIVEQHGGQIEVTSQPGAGSCFTLVLPAGQAVRLPVTNAEHTSR